MVRPEDYLPPDAAQRRADAPVAAPPTWLRRHEGPLLMTLFVAAGIAWASLVGATFGHPRLALPCGGLVAVGLASVVRPAWGMFFGQRWMQRDEPVPSRLALGSTRCWGVLFLAAGVALGVTGG